MDLLSRTPVPDELQVDVLDGLREAGLRDPAALGSA